MSTLPSSWCEDDDDQGASTNDLLHSSRDSTSAARTTSAGEHSALPSVASVITDDAAYIAHAGGPHASHREEVDAGEASPVSSAFAAASVAFAFDGAEVEPVSWRVSQRRVSASLLSPSSPPKPISRLLPARSPAVSMDSPLTSGVSDALGSPTHVPLLSGSERDSSQRSLLFQATSSRSVTSVGTPEGDAAPFHALHGAQGALQPHVKLSARVPCDVDVTSTTSSVPAAKSAPAPAIAAVMPKQAVAPIPPLATVMPSLMAARGPAAAGGAPPAPITTYVRFNTVLQGDGRAKVSEMMVYEGSQWAATAPSTEPNVAEARKLMSPVAGASAARPSAATLLSAVIFEPTPAATSEQEDAAALPATTTAGGAHLVDDSGVLVLTLPKGAGRAAHSEYRLTVNPFTWLALTTGAALPTLGTRAANAAHFCASLQLQERTSSLGMRNFSYLLQLVPAGLPTTNLAPAPAPAPAVVGSALSGTDSARSVEGVAPRHEARPADHAASLGDARTTAPAPAADSVSVSVANKGDTGASNGAGAPPSAGAATRRLSSSYPPPPASASVVTAPSAATVGVPASSAMASAAHSKYHRGRRSRIIGLTVLSVARFLSVIGKPVNQVAATPLTDEVVDDDPEALAPSAKVAPARQASAAALAGRTTTGAAPPPASASSASAQAVLVPLLQLNGTSQFKRRAISMTLPTSSAHATSAASAALAAVLPADWLGATVSVMEAFEAEMSRAPMCSFMLSRPDADGASVRIMDVYPLRMSESVGTEKAVLVVTPPSTPVLLAHTLLLVWADVVLA